MSQTVDTMQLLQREGEGLLRELNQALIAAYMGFRSPSSTNTGFDGKFRALFQKFEREVRLSPNTRPYYQQLRQSIESQRQYQVRNAEALYEDLPKQPGLAGGYNNLVGGGLSQLPGASSDALSSQIESLIGQMVNQGINHPEVPANVKNQISRNLSDWVRQQKVVQDALYFTQNVVAHISGWLHQRLIIKREIVRTRDGVKGRNQLTGAEADQADQAVGALAKQSQELDQQVEQQLRRISPTFGFNPKLVLDPSKGFLDEVEIRAGIRMTTRDVRVDLGVGVKVVDPFSPDAVSINPALNLNLRSGMQIGVEGQSGYDVGNQQWTHSVKATLRWSF